MTIPEPPARESEGEAARMATFPPYVIERTSRGERSYDIFSRLLMDRIVFLGTEINDPVANIVIAQLLFLDADDPGREIFLYINSPGGVVYSGLAIYDTINHLRAPVSTYCVGMAASMGAVLLSAGAKGKRNALPNSRIMLHQPSSGYRGTAADIEIAAKEVLDTRERLNRILAEATGQEIDKIAADVDRDRWMSAQEAVEYGLVDQVLVKEDGDSDGTGDGDGDGPKGAGSAKGPRSAKVRR